MNKLEETNNNGANDNSTDDGDNASDTAFENPVIKIFRGFPNLPHNVIGKIRYVIFFENILFIFFKLINAF